jgi:hypothetical protein
MLDQPLALITGLRTLLALWPMTSVHQYAGRRVVR